MFPGDYRKGGFSDLTSRFTERQLGRIIFVWTLAAATSCMLFPLFGLVRTASLYGVLGMAALWLCVRAASLLGTPARGPGGAKRAFAAINIFALVSMLLLIFDRGLTQ
jgi:heme O synthase-like polyprenyltransferase